MNLRLQSKRALVTGASVGIGAAIAIHLASEGVRSVVHGMSPESTVNVVSRIKDAGGQAIGVAGALGLDTVAAEVADNAQKAFGEIDILVNNAGRRFSEPWEQTAPEKRTELYNNNVTSMTRLNRLPAAPMVKSAGAGSSIWQARMA